jgi:LmbE family N-acetylglucosaminyl deacetylase
MTGLSLPAPPRRAIIVAPHPDDETIGAFGLIRLLVRSGTQVRVIVVTDGSASHKGSRAWPPGRLARARQRETIAAMRLAGLSRAALTFLGYQDGGLRSLGETGLGELAHRLGTGGQPDLVVRPTRCDHHPDHRAVAQACHRAWPARVTQLTYQVWPAVARPPGATRLVLGSDKRLKQAALALYRTQTGLISDDPEGFCIDRDLQGCFTRPVEWFGRS